MAKTAGGIRSLGKREKAKNNRKAYFNAMMISGAYSTGAFYEKSGGYYLIEKSTAKHKPEEIEVAKMLADKGYKVTLINEAGELKTADGKIFSLYYEQKTPEGSTAQNLKIGLEHAQSKKADVALFYMKHNRHTKQSVTDGIKLFEEKRAYRFREILIVTKDGRIHKHKHNK